MPALPTMNRPGSSTSWQPVSLTAGRMTSANALAGQRLLLAVVDAEAAAHVQVAGCRAPAARKASIEPDRLLASLPVRVRP